LRRFIALHHHHSACLRHIGDEVGHTVDRATHKVAQHGRGHRRVDEEEEELQHAPEADARALAHGGEFECGVLVELERHQRATELSRVERKKRKK
jgi:hypothetical protein